MNKTLRLTMMTLLMLAFGGSVSAEDIIWYEDWAGATEKVDPSTFKSNYTFTGYKLDDDGSFKSGTTFFNDNLAGGEAPELLIAKGGGSFAATIALGGRSGEMMLAFKCNRKLTVTVDGAVLGEVQNSGNDYLYPVTVAGGTSEITITFTQSATSANARFDNVKLYQGSAKLPAGLSFGTSERTVYLGAEDNKFPVLQNDNQVQVNFSSSDPSVATISAGGDITLVAAGQTTISAEFLGDDEYEAQTASYKLIVKEPKAEDPISSGGTQDNPLTVAEALNAISQLAAGASTTNSYYVKGFIVDDPDFQRKDDNTLYGNVNLLMADTKDGTSTLSVYRAKSFENAVFAEETITLLKKGDEVVFYGKLQNYVKNENSTPQLTSGYLYSVNGKTTSEGGEQPETKSVNVTEALSIADGLEDNKVTTEIYQVTGYVVGEPKCDTKTDGTLYGNINFTIANEKGGSPVLSVYRSKGFNNENITEETTNIVKEGDLVVVQGQLQKYVKDGVTTLEIKNCFIVSVTAGESKKLGDANGDGSVSVSDIVAVANYIAGDHTYTLEDCDVNKDNSVSVSDIVAIANIIAGGGSQN